MTSLRVRATVVLADRIPHHSAAVRIDQVHINHAWRDAIAIATSRTASDDQGQYYSGDGAANCNHHREVFLHK